jgi:hypothetical protein
MIYLIESGITKIKEWAGIMPRSMFNQTELNTTYNKVHPIYEPMYVILHAGNLMGDQSYVSRREFSIGVWIPEVWQT